jgi:parallel beta-helix repeat protein
MRKLLLVLAISLAALGLGVSNALAKELVVDKDKAQCPNADYTSIQAAVTAAFPGDKIKVCPDLYTESVTVPKTLDIVAAPKTALDSEDSCFATPPSAPDPTRDAIVAGVAYSFSLNANDIGLEGFVIQDAVTGVETSSSFSGYFIAENLVQSNAFGGINFLSSGARESRATHNCLRSNGEGLLSEIGPLLENARVDHNFATGNSTGIDASGVGARVNVTFDHNNAIGNDISYLISNSTNSRIVENRAEADANAIGIGGDNHDLEIGHNTVLAGAASGIVVFTGESFPVFPGPNLNLQISHNFVTQRGGSRDGIRIIDAFLNSFVEYNKTVVNSRDGIQMAEGNTGNLIAHNEADQNGRDGIHSSGSSGNLFIDNSMFDNVLFDAADDARPLNVWSGNHCNTDFPPGTICGVN